MDKKHSWTCARLQCMTRAERTANLIGVVVPFLGLLAAVVLLWNNWVDWTDLAIMAVTYLLFGFGVTVGYHRLLTHRAFQTHKRSSTRSRSLGSMGLQGSVLDWVADHRKHHAHTDQEGDPHSPHVGHGARPRAASGTRTPAGCSRPTARRTGRSTPATSTRTAACAGSTKAFPWLALEPRSIPTLLGFVLHGFTLEGALRGLIWGGLVRAFFLHHVTWSINSICHFFGRRRFDDRGPSTNVAWLALPSLGEAWHHNHHAFPRSAPHGLRWWEIDVSALVIRGMEKLGLAWNVVRITPERQAAKEAERKEPVAV